MGDVIMCQPAYISPFTSTTDTLLFASICVANYGNNVDPYFLYCVDLESRFDWRKFKNVSSIITIKLTLFYKTTDFLKKIKWHRKKNLLAFWKKKKIETNDAS